MPNARRTLMEKLRNLGRRATFREADNVSDRGGRTPMGRLNSRGISAILRDLVHKHFFDSKPKEKKRNLDN